MSIQLKNEVRELRQRIEELERVINILTPEKRIVAGQPEPETEDTRPKKRGRPAKAKE